MVDKTRSRIADRLGKSDNATVHGLCMTVANSWVIKWKRPSVIFCLIFKYPIKYVLLNIFPTMVLQAYYIMYG